VAVVALGLPWLLVPRSQAGPGGAESVEPSGAASSAIMADSASPASQVPLTRADHFGITFEYPAAWNFTDLGVYGAGGTMDTVASAAHALGFLGTGSATQTCSIGTQTAPAKCTTAWTLPEGSIEIRIGRPSWYPDNGVTYIWNQRTAISGPEIPGAQALTIDSLPARFARSNSDVVPYSSETVPGATAVLWWGLPLPLPSQEAFTIVAAMSGSDTTRLEAQAEAMVESIRFDREPTVLPTDAPGLEAARQAALENFFALQAKYSDDEHNHAYDCFPRAVGVSNQAMIIQTLNMNPMTQPLPVTCTTVSFDANPMQGWTIVLRQTWLAGADYAAGEAEATCTTLADGSPQDCSFGVFPYPHVGPSKYPG
jgi:hypothetical protein